MAERIIKANSTRIQEITAIIEDVKTSSAWIEERSEKILNAGHLKDEQQILALSIKIKNVLENLRSIFDYIAFDLHKQYVCKSGCEKDRIIYFPIKRTRDAFTEVIADHFKEVPTLVVQKVFEKRQAFIDTRAASFLEALNKLTGKLKHRLLTIAMIEETTRTEVSFGQHPFYKNSKGRMTRRLMMTPHVGLRRPMGTIGVDNVILRVLIFKQGAKKPIIDFVNEGIKQAEQVSHDYLSCNTLSHR